LVVNEQVVFYINGAWRMREIIVCSYFDACGVGEGIKFDKCVFRGVP
jgi:hypothetical protein